MLKTKWGSALLPAPTVAAAGTLAFKRLSSPRLSAVPCPSDFLLADRDPPVRFAVRFLPQAGLSFVPPRSVLAASAVPDHMGLAVAGAVAAVRALPLSLPLRACFLDPSRAPLPSAWPQSPAPGRNPRGDKGPVAFPCASVRVLCCRAQFSAFGAEAFAASDLLSGTPVRHPKPAFPILPFRRSQSAPQHAESGFIADLSGRPDQDFLLF